jgi:hypothetical protein
MASFTPRESLSLSFPCQQYKFHQTDPQLLIGISINDSIGVSSYTVQMVDSQQNLNKVMPFGKLSHEVHGSPFCKQATQYEFVVQ